MSHIDFESLFQRSKGQPVNVEGVEYCLMRRMQVDEPCLMRIVFVSSRPPNKQGIHIESDQGLKVNNIDAESVVLWEDTSPRMVDCAVSGGEVRIWNVWDVGDGVAQSWHNGAAMIVEEESPSRLIYKCNDGRPNADCNDLVFTCEMVTAPENKDD